MVICRPENVGTGMWYKDIKNDTRYSIALQEYTFIKNLFNPTFRIIVHQGLKGKERHYQVATADSIEEINKDWDFIQTIISSKPTDEGDIVDPALALVSLIFSRWKQQSSIAPRSPLSSRSESEFIIQRVDLNNSNNNNNNNNNNDSNHPLPPPIVHGHPDSQMHHSYSDPGLSRHDTLNTQNHYQINQMDQTNQLNQANQTNQVQSNQYHQYSQPNQTLNQPTQVTSPNHLSPTTSRAHPPPKPQSVFARSPASPTSPSSSSSSSSSHYSNTSTIQPTINASPLSLSSSDEITTPHGGNSQEAAHVSHDKEHHENDKHTHEHKHGHKGTHDCMLDTGVLAEIMAWEKRKTNLQTKMDVLMKKKTAHMQGVFNDYLEAVRGIVMGEAGLSDDIKMQMISQEYLRLESLNIFNTKSCAIITCVEEQIKTTERAGQMKKSVIKLQALTRGFLVRRKYRPQIKSQRHRNKCVRELLDTERTYVRLLEVLVEVFLQPLRASSMSKSPLMRKDLFSNIESLLFVNKELLDSLEQRLSSWGPKSLIGDILIKLAPYMKMYTQYVNSYIDSLNTLNKYSKSPEFQDFMKQAKTNPKLKSMDLASFLILPVQRIPRYVLLIQEIVKVTPASHPDSSNLQKALDLIQDVARIINESKRRAENTNKVMEIQSSILMANDKHMEDLVQPHRKFRKEGALVRDVDSSLEDCYVYLFSDMLLITQKRKGFLEENYHYLYKDSLKFASATIRSIPDSRLWQNGFSITSASKSERFFTDNEKNKNDWITAISEVIEEVKKNLQTLKVEEEPPVVEEQPTSTINPPSPSISSQQPHLPAHPSLQNLHNSTHLSSPSTQSPRASLSHSHSRQSINLSAIQLTHDKAHTEIKLKQVIALYRQALQLESDLFVLPYQIKTLIPSITVTPQNIQELQSRVTLLSSRIAEIDGIHDNVVFIIREEKSVLNLDRLISQGMVHIDSMLKYLTATFPKEMTPNATTRNSVRQSTGVSLSLPYQLMSSILSWYLSVTDNWAIIMEKQV